MNVLSLFDGMSCGQIALNRAGIKYNNYYASEIKEHAIKVTKNNYPETIHIGDVTKIDFKKLPKIDLLIGGSPCQDFSRGNKERLGLEGSKSSLFFKYVEALGILKPKYFLLENVVMDIEDNNFITKTLGIMPVRINSSLVSAQLRDRNYWTNIPGSGGLFGDMIEQPKNRNINLNDVLDRGYCPSNKARCLLESDSRALLTPVKMFHRFCSTGFTTLIFKSKKHYELCRTHYDKNYKGLTSDKFTMDNSVYEDVRYMSQEELEKCQTVPYGYTFNLKRNGAARLLGDGWTVDVICHILNGIT
jgi:DNA (cytosine-5)-methyltransferase 3A